MASPVWVNLYQARVVEEEVRQLTTLTSSGPNWPYALVQLNGDTHHVPLPREGHLCILTEGGTNSATCRWISQLEVNQLLSSDSQVIYPIGLNGCEAPMVASLPKSLARGANLLGCKLIYLKGGHPTIHSRGALTEGTTLWPLSLHPNGHLCQGFSAKGRGRGQQDHGSEETLDPGSIRYIWTWVNELNPKETKSCDCTHTSAPQTGGSLWFSGHIIPKGCTRWWQEGEASLEEIPTVPSPIAETPGPSSGTLSNDAGLLCKEANKTLGDLLATKSSIEAHQWKLVWELSMALFKMSLKQPNLSRKPRPLVTQLSRKTKPPLPTPYRRLKHFVSRPKPPALSPCRRPNPLLHGHQGCRGLGSLPGWLTSEITCQVHLVPGRASHWGGEQESAQHPLHLSNCSVSQPCRTL